MSRGSGSRPQVCQSIDVAVAFELDFRNNLTVSSKQVKEEMPMKKSHDIQTQLSVKANICWRHIKRFLAIVTAIFLIGVYGDGFSSSA